MNQSKNIRTQIAEDTIKALENGFYIGENEVKIDFSADLSRAVNDTHLYEPEESDRLIKEFLKAEAFQGKTELVLDTSLNTVRRLWQEGERNILLLNFASAKNPGGGFLGGSQAQEESIARASGLYPCLLKAEKYYKANRQERSCFYTDHMIYSPGVPVLKDEEGKYLDEYVKVSIITAPAVNAGVVKQREREKLSDIENVMKRRMKKVLAIASRNKHDVIVLGAWGCGVFQNDPADIAKWFREVIEEAAGNKFRRIIFAIKSRDERILKPFYENFGA